MFGQFYVILKSRRVGDNFPQVLCELIVKEMRRKEEMDGKLFTSVHRTKSAISKKPRIWQISSTGKVSNGTESSRMAGRWLSFEIVDVVVVYKGMAQGLSKEYNKAFTK